MTETVVHVTTLEQWKVVLDIWYEQGYQWEFLERKNEERHFESGGRFLFLDYYITYSTSIPSFGGVIEYSEFMAQQKEDKKMAMVYEVSQSVFDDLQLIKVHEGTSLIGAITLNSKLIKSIEVGNKAILRYLADDPAIELKVKEQLYRLWRIDSDGERVYMKFSYGTPTWITDSIFAFIAPQEEIKKWKTPAWEIEKAD